MNTTYILSYPPTINSYWATYKGRRILSVKGRKYKDIILGETTEQGKVVFGDSRLFLSVKTFQPDKRIRDLDNILKPILDSLKYAGIFDDDGQIDKLEVVRGPVDKASYIEVCINKII